MDKPRLFWSVYFVFLSSLKEVFKDELTRRLNSSREKLKFRSCTVVLFYSVRKIEVRVFYFLTVYLVHFFTAKADIYLPAERT